MRSILAAILCLAFVGLTGNSTGLAAQQKTPPTGSASTSPNPAAKATTGADQFAEESQANSLCIGVNLSSKIYHFHGTKDYGNTKSGAYVCEKDATSQGFRAAKNEKHP